MFPVCLQKAIIDCDEEWAMNKKVVDLSSKDVRQSVCSLFSLSFYQSVVDHFSLVIALVFSRSF